MLLPYASYVILDFPGEAEGARFSLEQFFGALTEPAILDDSRYAPDLFRHLKIAVDRDRRPERFV